MTSCGFVYDNYKTTIILLQNHYKHMTINSGHQHQIKHFLFI
nr:MAG TPA: hypothetical protein [Caudoviricetes sp.]